MLDICKANRIASLNSKEQYGPGNCCENPSRSPFDSLPLRPGDPPFSAWYLCGKDDKLGTLNLLIPETVKAAKDEIKHGINIPLNLRMEVPLRPMNPARKPCQHLINAKGRANDDRIDFDTQGRSHWDGLRPYPYQTGEHAGKYFNGVTQEDISSANLTAKLGIQSVAKGIVARGVLLDYARYASQRGIEFSPFERHAIPLEQLKEVAADQCVKFRQGDILVIRTGWTKAYKTLSDDEKLALPDREVRASCGVEANEEMLRRHW